MDRGHFSIFGIPVRVQWTFAITILFGLQSGIQGALTWAAIVFVSVLLHELGHAFMGRLFGLEPSIQLYAFGGQTSWIGGKNIGHGKSLLISLAGPAVSLALGLVGFVVASFYPSDPSWKFFGVNVFWGVFNLLPIMPMDGGNALRSFFYVLGLRKLAEVGTRVIGIALAIPLAIYTGVTHESGSLPFLPMFLVMFAVSNIQSLVAYLRQSGDQEVLAELQKNYPRWMEAKDGKGMIAAGLAARNAAKTDYLRAFSTEVLAMGQCLDGDAKSALATLESGMPQGMMPGLSIYLHVLFEAGEQERAMTLAKQMMNAGDDDLKQQAETVLAARQQALAS